MRGEEEGVHLSRTRTATEREGRRDVQTEAAPAERGVARGRRKTEIGVIVTTRNKGVKEA